MSFVFPARKAARLFAGWVAVSGFAFADDGAISWGGNPQLLKGHPTVSMLSEHIVLTVHKGDGEAYADADCTFTFHNHGPACTVRIGFPDRSEGALEQNFSKPSPDFPHPTYHILENFRSWVDGKPAKTTIVLSQDSASPGATYGGSWHVKTVKFKKNQNLVIRDTYRQPQSGGATNSGPTAYLNQLEYILSTGASWNGPIGSVEVDVRIKPMVSAKPLRELTKGSPYEYAKWQDTKIGDFFYSGFAKPIIENGVLVFKAKNLKPTTASDINIYWSNAASKR